MVNIYTDGSCLRNPGPGGWAAIVRKEDGSEVVLKGKEADSTNNRMEMTAILESLKWIAKNEIAEATIHSDSRLVLNTITEGWKKKKNTDLWEKIDKLMDQLIFCKIEWKWVKGHAGHEFNERVDDIAREEAIKVSGGKAVATKDKEKQGKGGEFFCNKCKKDVAPDFLLMKKSGLLKASCPGCKSYIKFASKTKANLAKAKKEK